MGRTSQEAGRQSGEAGGTKQNTGLLYTGCSGVFTLTYPRERARSCIALCSVAELYHTTFGTEPLNIHNLQRDHMRRLCAVQACGPLDRDPTAPGEHWLRMYMFALGSS